MLYCEILEINGINTAKLAMNTCVGKDNKKVDLLNCCGNEYNSYHKSIYEHIIIQYKVVAPVGIISQLNRHKFIAISQKSTRFALKSMLSLECTSTNEEVKKAYADIMSVINELKCSTNDELKNLLPQGMLTEVVYTQTLSDFIHLIVRRLGKSAHADARLIASLLYSQIEKNEIVKEIIIKVIRNIYKYELLKNKDGSFEFSEV